MYLAKRYKHHTTAIHLMSPHIAFGYHNSCVDLICFYEGVHSLCDDRSVHVAVLYFYRQNVAVVLIEDEVYLSTRLSAPEVDVKAEEVLLSKLEYLLAHCAFYKQAYVMACL